MEPLTPIFNDCIANLTFPDEPKYADVTSLPKNEPANSKTNFKPTSVLPTASKLFEGIMDKQTIAYITPFLSWLLSGFRKGYSAQHALSRLLEKFKVSLDEGGKAGAVLMNLSKAFDCIREVHKCGGRGEQAINNWARYRLRAWLRGRVDPCLLMSGSVTWLRSIVKSLLTARSQLREASQAGKAG